MTRTKSTYLALLASSLCLFSVDSQAVPIEITGAGSADGLWDLSIVTGVPGDASLLDVLDDQVWWGDSALAELFANTCGPCLGIQFAAVIGPYFSYEDWNIAGSRGWAYWTESGSAANWVEGSGTTPITVEWAKATRITVPEPGTLALLCVGLFGMGLASRKRKEESS